LKNKTIKFIIFILFYFIQKPSTASNKSIILQKKNCKNLKEKSQLFLEKLYKNNHLSLPNASKIKFYTLKRV
jgi:hypothetical protein